MFLLNSGHLPSLKGVTKYYARSYLYYTHLAEAHIYKHILSERESERERERERER